jgi:1-acyl-sn-glycerol-3-phosphate acyltransferase
MAKKELFDHKVAGPLLRGMHHINVDRNNGAPSYVAALKALKAGEIVGIFPEATISTSFEIKQLKSGALRLAVDAGVPIVPTIVWGGQRVSTKGVKPNFKRGKTPVSVSFGEPIHYAKDVDIETASEELRQVMISMLNQVQEKYPDSHVGQRWAPARLGGTAPAPLN